MMQWIKQSSLITGMIIALLGQPAQAEGVTAMDLMSVVKHSGECDIMRELLDFYEKTDITTGGDIVLRFWKMRAASKGLDVEQYATQCKKTLDVYQKLREDDEKGYMQQLHFVGRCQVMQEMIAFSKRSEMVGSADFVMRFWKSEAAMRGVDAEEQYRQCSSAQSVYEELEKRFKDEATRQQNAPSTAPAPQAEPKNYNYNNNNGGYAF